MNCFVAQAAYSPTTSIHQSENLNSTVTEVTVSHTGLIQRVVREMKVS